MAAPTSAGSKPATRGSSAPVGGGGASFLTQKVGPLPVWGYLVALVAGYLIYKHLTGSTSSTASTTGATTGSTTATGEPSETVTLPGGYSYTGPATGALPGVGGTPGSTPGTTGTSTTPGSGGNAGGTPYPGYSLVTENVANTVAADLVAGSPVYYSAAAGQALLPVTKGAGGGWLAGGTPITQVGSSAGPPGAPSGYYVPTPAAS